MPAAWSALVVHYKSKCNLTTDAEAEDRIRIDVAAGNGGNMAGSPPASAPAPARSVAAVKPAQPVPRVKPKPTAAVASLKLKPIQASPVKSHNAVPNTVVAPRAQHGSSSKLPPLSASSSSRAGPVHEGAHHEVLPLPPLPASPPSQQKDSVHEAAVVVDDASHQTVAVVSVTLPDTSTMPRQDHPDSSANRTADNSNEIEHGMIFIGLGLYYINISIFSMSIMQQLCKLLFASLQHGQCYGLACPYPVLVL